MCLYVDSYSEVLSEGEPVARTHHNCHECRRVIEPGEKYHRWSVVEEGDFTVYKMCAHCEAMIHWGSRMTHCPENWFWGTVLDLSEEEGFVGNIVNDPGHGLRPQDEMAYRVAALRGRQRGWRDDRGNLYPIPGEVAA